jgi:hypothetical protein
MLHKIEHRLQKRATTKANQADTRPIGHIRTRRMPNGTIEQKDRTLARTESHFVGMA